MAELTDIQRDLQTLEAELKRLEAEYNMFFAGRLPRPPWETRGRVEAMVKQYDRGHIQNTGDRFRFETLQARFQTFIDLWDRGLRAREEGRPGPFAQPRPKAPPRSGGRTEQGPPRHRVQGSGARDGQAARALRLADGGAARAGEDVVPFHQFAALVKDQVTKLRESGNRRSRVPRGA